MRRLTYYNRWGGGEIDGSHCPDQHCSLYLVCLRWAYLLVLFYVDLYAALRLHPMMT